MHAYVDVDMQMHILMQMNAYVCICMLGMHIPLAGGAHPGGPPPFGGGAVKPGTQDIYIPCTCLYNTHLDIHIYLYVHIYIYTYVYITYAHYTKHVFPSTGTHPVEPHRTF